MIKTYQEILTGIIGKWTYNNGLNYIEFRDDGVAMIGYTIDVYEIEIYPNLSGIRIHGILAFWLIVDIKADLLVFKDVAPGTPVDSGTLLILNRI
jgi:hypothetical protein